MGMVNVGANKETVTEARLAIMAILGAGCEEKTIRQALVTLASITSVMNTSITNCHFTGESDD